MQNRIGPIQYYGGKANLAIKIVPLIPRSRIYAEVYGGGASILMNLSPRPVEIYNDINKNVVNLFRCLQDVKRAEKLHRRLCFTLYSVEEFQLAMDMLRNKSQAQDDRAWAQYVICNQGFAGHENINGTKGNWGRVFTSNRKMAGNVSRYWSRFDNFEFWHRRLAKVQIDCKDAIEFIQYWDSTDTTFYLDPPYVLNTRKAKKTYQYECGDSHHKKLVKTLLKIKGNAILSGYNNDLYKPLTDAGWKTIEFNVKCYASNTIRENRKETLWIKQNMKMF